MSEETLSKRELDLLLAAAVAAPSMHSTQPWRFTVDGLAIDIGLDRSRTLPAEDPTGRAMRIAAGAALFNLRCAAAHLGYDSRFGLQPDPGDADVMARVVLGRTDRPDRVLAGLAAQIPRRHTARTPARPAPPSEFVERELVGAAFLEGGELTWLSTPLAYQLMHLILDADLREIHDWRRGAERARWVGGARTEDGVPSAALGPRSTGYPGPVRDLGTAPRDRLRRATRFEAAPDIAVLSTTSDSPADQVQAGIALERILLTATRDGLSASFLNQPLEYDVLRAKAQRLTGKPGYAHMVIRFAHTSRGVVTARRPTSAFLDEQEARP